MDLHDRLEVLQLAADLLHFLPDVGAGHGAERDQDLGVRGLEDFRDLMRLQKRVDGIGDAGGFGAEQRHKGLGQQRKQEAHHVAAADTERVKHVGGLRHARDEIAVADDDWRVGRVGIGQELDGGCIGIVGGAELNGIIGALGGDAVSVRDLFEGTDVGSEAKVGYSLPMRRSSEWMPVILCPPYVSFQNYRLFALRPFPMQSISQLLGVCPSAVKPESRKASARMKQGTKFNLPRCTGGKRPNISERHAFLL